MDLKVFARHERMAQIAGLLLRIMFLATCVPAIYRAWFLPFLEHAAQVWGVDPWTGFLERGGDPLAFPYGPLYIAVFGPLTWVGGAFSERSAALGLGFTVLLLDAALFWVLRRLVARGQAVVVTYGYWLSPIVLYVCYWHGQLDVFPALMLAASLLLVREAGAWRGGIFLGLATSAKLSMGLAIPFIWIYAMTRRLRVMVPGIMIGTLVGLMTLFPFAASPGFRKMVLETPEKEKVFALAIPYGADLHFYVMPLALTVLLAVAWRVRRINFDVLFGLIGIGFFVLFLLTPASPGWAMWLMPFLVMHLTRQSRTSWALVVGFSVLFATFHLATSSGVRPLDFFGTFTTPHLRGMLLSSYLATGGAITYQMIQSGIIEQPFYQASRRPLVLGIAGDSGAGKDTLALALANLFGERSTAMVSGDDYHLWDRHKPMWRALTHLNPRANNLRGFTRDALALAAGRAVHAPHYDHQVGRMSKPLVTRPTDVVIASGLHALHPPELLGIYNISIFLAMDEQLRRYFKLRRDVLVRGHAPDAVLSSLAKRSVDSDRYIRPQAAAADLVMSLVPIDAREVADPLNSSGSPRMGLAVESRNSDDFSKLLRVLIGIAGLDAVEERSPNGDLRLVIDGNPTAKDISSAAMALTPDMFDFLALNPAWSSGLTGIMQLVVLDRLAERIYTSRKVG